MAYYNDEEEQKDEGTGQSTSPDSGVIGSGGGQAPVTSAKAPDQSFVGISKYLDANKNQSDKLAGQVAGNIDQKAAGVDSALDSAQNSFNQSADSQKVTGDDDLFGQVKSNAQSVVGDPNKVSQFTKLRDANYTGPQNLQTSNGGQDWAGIQSALQTAQNAKAASGTEAGRMGLIKEISNNPRQSQGGLVFDNLLLQSNPNAAGRLSQAGQSLNSFGDKLTAANQADAERAAAIKNQNLAVGQQARNALTEGYTGLQSDLAGRESTADAQQVGQIKALRQAIQNGTLTEDQYKLLNMQAGDKTYGTDLSRFVNYKDDIDKYSVANQDDLARQSALKQLAGDNSLGDDILSSANPLGQKGPGFTTDLAGFQTAKDAGLKKYSNAVADINNNDLNWRDPAYNLDYSSKGSSLNNVIQATKNEIARPGADESTINMYQRQLDFLLGKQKQIQNLYNYNTTLGQAVPGQTSFRKAL